MNIADELKWMQDHPEFEERPASIEEFLGPRYLNIEKGVRHSILVELRNMFGKEVDSTRMACVRYAIFSGGIGIGKTTVASIVLPYMAHWCLCLKNPQAFFGLLPGSRIAFMMMSTSERQAKEVLFADIDARIKHSPWFQQKYPKDPTFKTQIRFPKDIWLLPGDSAETTFEGYNILGGIIDEIDSHKVTQEKDYAENGFDTINSRIESRFGERGFLLLIGQTKRANGFAARKFQEFKNLTNAYATRLTIWESFGWDKYLNLDGSRDSFFYDVKRKCIVPNLVAPALSSESVIEIPRVYYQSFVNNPEKALRDLAGIPPATGDPFISLVDRVEEARDRWVERFQAGSPVRPEATRIVFEPWFKAKDRLKRAIHIDFAVSPDGDALGLAMGHVREVVEIDDEKKPYIVFDMLARVKAAPGTEIFFADIRHAIYHLRDDLGFNIKTVTMDGFQSTDSRQQLSRKRFWTEVLSVDRQLIPYYDLREAIYERRIEFPPYVTYIKPGDTEKVEIAIKELAELEDNGKKIDHPETGSKDVADAMAGVCFVLMGDRSFSRNVVSLDAVREEKRNGTTGYSDEGSGLSHPALGNFGSIGAPLPPSELGLGLLPRLPTERRG